MVLVKYEKDMTTKMDMENILYTAEKRGEKRGEARGEAKGAAKALVTTARRMVYELGYTVSQAAEATGLHPEKFMDS